MKISRRQKIRNQRRDTIYKMLKNRFAGVVPCFLCGMFVAPSDASLEHIKPLSEGGTDLIGNLTIAHIECNSARGSKPLTADQIARIPRMTLA